MSTIRKLGTFFVNGLNILKANKDNKTLTLPPIQSLLDEIEYEFTRYDNQLKPKYPYYNEQVLDKLVDVFGWLENGHKTIDGTLYETFSKLPSDKTILDNDDFVLLDQITLYTEIVYDFPTSTLSILNGKLDKYRELQTTLENPQTRANYFALTNGGEFYTDGEKAYDSYVLSNKYNLEAFLNDLNDNITLADAKINGAPGIEGLETRALNARNTYNTISLTLKNNFLDFCRMLYDFKDENGNDFTELRKAEIVAYFNTEPFYLITPRFNNLMVIDGGYLGLMDKFNTDIIPDYRSSLGVKLSDYNIEPTKASVNYPDTRNAVMNSISYTDDYRNPYYLTDLIRYNNVSYVSQMTGWYIDDDGNGRYLDLPFYVDERYYSVKVKISTGVKYYGTTVLTRNFYETYKETNFTPGVWFRVDNIIYSSTPNVNMSEYLLNDNLDLSYSLTTPNLPHKINLLNQIIKTISGSHPRKYDENYITKCKDNYKSSPIGYCPVYNLINNYYGTEIQYNMLYTNISGAHIIRYTFDPEFVSTSDKDYDLSITYDEL